MSAVISRRRLSGALGFVVGEFSEDRVARNAAEATLAAARIDEHDVVHRTPLAPCQRRWRHRRLPGPPEA
jgi:hypothetical protein